MKPQLPVIDMIVKTFVNPSRSGRLQAAELHQPNLNVINLFIDCKTVSFSSTSLVWTPYQLLTERHLPDSADAE